MTKQKIAVITGADGQDFYYLSNFLLDNKYLVYGVTRRTGQSTSKYIKDHSYVNDNIQNLKIIYGDLSDEASLYHIIKTANPDEFYNLAGFSHPGLSFEQPEITMNINGMAVLRILDIIRNHSPKTRFCQISSPDMFANAEISPQNEITPHCPNSPYGVSKSLAHNIVKLYRDSYNIFATNCICYNHESPKRNELFVTKKITQYVASFYRNNYLEPLMLGNLNARRDWGSVSDYIYGMYLALNYNKPDDFLFSTGKTHSVRELCQLAFKYIGLSLTFENEGINECGLIGNKTVIKVDPTLYRPVENKLLVGDYTKASKLLKWQPTVSFDKIIEDMVEYDLKKY